LAELIREADPGFASGERSPDGVLQVRMNCVDNDGGLDLAVAPRVPAIPRLSRYLLEPGDVLFNATNSPELVGKSALFTGSDEPVTFSNHFLRLRVRVDRLEPSYLVRWLARQWKRRVFEGMCAQWVNQASVRCDRLLQLKVPLPPLAEQRRIAAVLDKADAIRRKRRESLRLLDELLRSAFLEMFGDPVRNEKGWDVAPLEDLIDPARPITYGILKPGPDTPGGVPYVRVVDMANGTVKRTGVKRTTRAIAEAYRRSVLRAGDLLLSIRGHVGRIALVPDELEAANITQDTARLALLPGHSTAYVAASLTSSPMQSHMRRYVKGVAVTGINLGDVKKLPVPTPPLELQQRFTSVALRHSRMSARAREAQETTRRLFDSLAQRAFREHSE
jgi:type I restriction enzyme S subunit